VEKPGSGMHVNKLGSTARQKLQCDEASIQMLSAQMANIAYSSAPRLIQALTWFKKLGVRVKVAIGRTRTTSEKAAFAEFSRPLAR